jgi:magnesium chelatase family protein
MPGMVTRYQKRISGPIMDRIDLHVHVPAVDTGKLIYGSQKSKAESSASVRQRVQEARNRQSRRLAQTGIVANAEMSTRMVKELCPLSAEMSDFIKQAIDRLSLSARSYYRVIKVARTIADLAGDKEISVPYLAEALQYRQCQNFS